MTRGTTPTVTFYLKNFPQDAIANAEIDFSQNGELLLVKKNPKIEDKKISCDLTEEETLKFSSKDYVYVQVIIKTKDDKLIRSSVFQRPVRKALNEEVAQWQ